MARQPKLPDQDYFQDIIVDTRISSTLGVIATAEHQSEQAEQEKSWRQPGAAEVKKDHYDLPWVHNLDQLEYVGSDGETSGGCINLLQVTDASDGETKAVIHSYLGSRETGLPFIDGTWFAEFTDVQTAQKFWKQWRPDFQVASFIASMNEYQKGKAEITSSTLYLQRLGLLKPWFLQKEGDHRFLERFSSVGVKLADIPLKYRPEPAHQAGRVYRVPVFDNPYLRTPTDYAAKTCLTAFTVPQQKTGMWREKIVPAHTAVQWSDGELRMYAEDSEYQPVPLARRDIARRAAASALQA